ncbi:MAG: transposase [Candidatus Omnitrophota bacterium]
MPNYYHLLIKTMEANLNRMIHYVNMGYANYFNRKRQRNGHLFQGRYKAILLEEACLPVLSRYVHLNPVRAKIVDLPENYPWSSYRYYISEGKLTKSAVSMSVARLKKKIAKNEKECKVLNLIDGKM